MTATDPQNLIWVIPAEGDVNSSTLCVVLAGGSGAPVSPLPAADLVIAADGGLALAAELDLAVDLIVGDLDSAVGETVTAAVAKGAELERHPVAKDATDLELALDAAARRGADRVIVVGGGGVDRIDHVLGNAMVLAAERFAAYHPEWWIGPSRAVAVRDHVTIEGSPGDLISIITVRGEPRLTTSGLTWALVDETLAHGSTRGVSNLLKENTAAVNVTGGVVFVVHTKGTS